MFGILKTKMQHKGVNKLPWWYRVAPVLSQGITWIPWERTIRTLNKLQITGKENLKQAIQLRKKYNSGVLFAVKHTGELDIMLVLTAITPFSTLFPMFYLRQHAKYYTTENFGWRKYLYGQFLFYLFGAHPLKGGDGTYSVLENQENYKEALSTHTELLKRNCSVCVFPEGHIPSNNEFGHINGGLGYLADTKAVIIPVSIKRESGDKKQVIKLHYGKPLNYDEHISKYKKEYENENNPYKKISHKIVDHIKKDIKDI